MRHHIKGRYETFNIPVPKETADKVQGILSVARITLVEYRLYVALVGSATDIKQAKGEINIQFRGLSTGHASTQSGGAQPQPDVIKSSDIHQTIWHLSTGVTRGIAIKDNQLGNS